MRPTRLSLLALVFVVFGVLAGVVLAAAYDHLPPLPGGPVVTVAVAAVLVGFLAWTTHNRMTGQRGARPPEPMMIARYAALARACSPVGAGLAGAWAGALGYLLTLHGGVDAVAHDRRTALVGVVTALLLTGAALWLERVCRIPDDRRPDPQPT